MITVRKPGIERSIPENRLDFFLKAGYEKVSDGQKRNQPVKPPKFDADQAVLRMAAEAKVDWRALEFKTEPTSEAEVKAAIDQLVSKQEADAKAKEGK